MRLELGVNLGPRKRTSGGEPSPPGLFDGAVHIWRASDPGGSPSTTLQDTGSGAKDLTVENAVYTGSGTGAYYAFNGNDLLYVASNSTLLGDIHKTTGSAWTIAFACTTGTIDNDFIFGTINASGIQNGLSARWTGAAVLNMIQYTAAASNTISTGTIPNSDDVIVCISYDPATDNYRYAINTETHTEVAASRTTNTNAADDVFTFGGYGGAGGVAQLNMDIYGIVAYQQFLDATLAATIHDDFETDTGITFFV